MNIRHDVANYYKSTDDEKNEFWIKELNTSYSEVSIDNRVKMNHSSKLVEAYIASSDMEKHILWSLYDEMSQLYSDYDKWTEKVTLRKALKEVS